MMFDKYGFISFDPIKPSHYEQQVKWELSLQGKTTNEKIVAACNDDLDDWARIGHMEKPEARSHKPAVELTEEQRSFLIKCKADQEMQRTNIELGLYQPHSPFRIKA